jgi:radical SAM protein with 4Fe4S-binding SPASM domain
LNWFDAKAGAIAGLPSTHEDTRCGFGDGEIAVAPSGRLYPCERLIGEDRPDHPLRLPGHALEGEDFLGFAVAPVKDCDACASCALNAACEADCRCSNFVRTGNVNHPDGLLCTLNKATARAVAAVLGRNESISPIQTKQPPKVSYG